MVEAGQRAIVHLDADAFFASVEQAADARLRGQPVAVGGAKRGIIASASYEARKFGVYTPMPTALARRLCPKLVLLPGDFDKYELFSRLMFSYAYDFTPDVEIGSIDEGYFDLTGARQPAWNIAETIRQAIRQSLRLSVSEGIATNKLVSQIASKLNKPAAFQWVPRGQEAQFLAPLPNQWLPGIGSRTATQLQAAGLARIGQIAGTPPDLLGLLVGNLAAQLRRFALGLDERPVVPARAPAKSYSEQETFAADTTDQEFLEATLQRMADKLMGKVRADGKSVRTLMVKVRYNDMDEEQASESLAEPTDLETEIYARVTRLLRQAWKRRVSLRLVSLKLANVYDGRFRSGLALDAAARRHDAQQRLAGMVDVLRQKYGRRVLLRGHDFLLLARNRAGGRPTPVPPSGAAVSAAAAGVSPAQNLPATALRGREARVAGGDACATSRIAHRASRLPPPRSTYIPLNVHSYYSFLDSTLSLNGIVDMAKRHDLPAIALTDRNNLHGAVEFAQVAAQAGIKPIIGTELAWQGWRLCLYVQNQTGYHNLCRVLNAVAAPSATPPFFNSPAQTDGLLAVSPSAELAPLFPGRFYLAVDSAEAPNGGGTPLPCVASLPIHYERPADHWKYDVVQSIRTLTLLRQQHPQKRLGGEYHFRPAAELQRLFAARPEWLAHSGELADRCAFAFLLGKPQFPSYAPPDGSRPAAFLRRLVLAGLRRRYPQGHARLKPQLEEELAIITEVGYEEYFLVMWDILQECRRRGIQWLTRGSAADSLACYCLGISQVCPIRFELYFRRFLNRERMALQKLPDIDVDFPHDRKDDVLDLIFEKYGPAHAAMVGGFSTFQSRSAFAEVAKVLGVSEFQVRRLTGRLPPFGRASELAAAVAATPEGRALPLDQEPYSTALQMAQFLDGFPRYPKMHPCGLVLSRQPMPEITPCFVSAKGYPTTHFDMDSVEALGLVKMDILAQGGLAVMRDVRAMLGAPPAIPLPHSPVPPLTAPLAHPSPPKLDLEALEPWDDPQVWEMIAGGSARAVHHIESPAMISLCKMCAVRDIDTLIAIVSVIRPGAANESKKLEFARRYQGLSPVRYPHPALEPCLRSTYGLVVYEEHILQLCEAFAGLPPGRADLLRRALGKEQTALIGQLQSEFAARARRRGRTEAEIAEVWKLVAGFRGYAFCKAHSTAYGVEAYQSAWLKRYYPAQFMAAVLSNGKGFYQPLVYVLECHRLGIPLLAPSVNDPGPQFTVRQGKIRVPLLRLKGLTQRTAQASLRERAQGEFSSLSDFLLRVQPLPEEMEALIRVGAFDAFGQTRTTQYWEFKALCASRQAVGQRSRRPRGGAAAAPAKHLSGTALGGPDAPPAGARPAPLCQLWLFPPGNLDHLPSVPLAEPQRLQRLRWEEELLGFPASGHPLELFPDIAWDTYCPVRRLGEHLGEQVVTCGLVIEQRLFQQSTGEPMKFLTLADWTGVVETELFARTYQSYGLNTLRYRVLEISATVEPFENGGGYTLRVLRAGKPRRKAQFEIPGCNRRALW
ncbi:MAG: DNA polymerase IV [Verrucomicrobiota bacterium]|jgi:error-prone DNA polymerase